MNSRQRILAALDGNIQDRIPLTEIGIWPETIRRWKTEGLPENLSPHDYFDLDKIGIYVLDRNIP